ncbi:MAG: hypothetical protein HY963_09775 [Ignavibacteriales bacterium]|nr:hypothetical protein [Ignavibacteriales bacterium]
MSEEEIKKIVTTILPNDNKRKMLFEKIKILQSLPDEIIYDFLNCKSVLRATNYKSKFPPHAK